MSFEGKVAFITGAGSGIGRATAQLLASQGAKVAAADLRAETAGETAAAIVAAGGKAIGVGVNVSNKAEVSAAVARTVQEFGALDILINCAGIYPRALVVDIEESQWDQVIGTHLKGTFLCCQAALKQMIRQQSGRIVNIVSGIAINGARRGSAYSAAKGGIMSFTKSLALEVREHGIMVNALSPGPTRTPMSSWGSAKPGDASYAEMIGQHPQGLKEPEQAAQYVTTLAGSLFDHTTGRIMHF